jgi:phosphatidylglycerophosphate synthase
MKSFTIKSIILTILIFLIGVVLYSTALKQFYFRSLPVFVFVYLIATNLVHAYFLKNANSKGSRFNSQYMAASFLKMFFYLIVAIVFVILNKEIAKPFLINFLVLYVIFTIFEVYEISKAVRTKNE